MAGKSGQQQDCCWCITTSKAQHSDKQEDITQPSNLPPLPQPPCLPVPARLPARVLTHPLDRHRLIPVVEELPKALLEAGGEVLQGWLVVGVCIQRQQGGHGGQAHPRVLQWEGEVGGRPGREGQGKRGEGEAGDRGNECTACTAHSGAVQE